MLLLTHPATFSKPDQDSACQHFTGARVESFFTFFPEAKTGSVTRAAQQSKTDFRVKQKKQFSTQNFIV